MSSNLRRMDPLVRKPRTTPDSPGRSSCIETELCMLFNLSLLRASRRTAACFILWNRKKRVQNGRRIMRRPPGYSVLFFDILLIRAHFNQDLNHAPLVNLFNRNMQLFAVEGIALLREHPHLFQHPAADGHGLIFLLD